MAGAAQAENGPAVMAPPTGTVRVHLLVPRDQRYVDGITQVMVEAQRYWWTRSTCSRS